MIRGEILVIDKQIVESVDEVMQGWDWSAEGRVFVKEGDAGRNGGRLLDCRSFEHRGWREKQTG
jgi:hypothetical protein